MQSSTPEACLDHLAVCRRALVAIRRNGLASWIEPEELIAAAALALVRENVKDEALAFTVARSSMLMSIRSASVRRRNRDDVEDIEAVAGSGSPMASGPDLNLWEAVKALPPREYRAVTLHFWANRTYAEIGDELGISAPRVSQIISAAKKILRVALNKRNSQAIT